MQIPFVENYVQNIVGKFIVSGTNKGINGFVFDVESQDEISAEADATDHYVEANYAVQDHIALRPKTITLKGFVGELKDTAINAGLGILTRIQSLGDIGGLAPDFGAQATQTYNRIWSVVSRVDSYINQANNLSTIFDDKTTTSTKQKAAFEKLASFRDARELCTVTTPFGIFKNMAIIRMSAIQRDESAILSDFTVTLKEIRTVDSIIKQPKVASGRAAQALSSVLDMGQVTGKPLINVTVENVFATR